MEINLAAFLGISALVIVTPGQDTALTIRNTLVGGRRAGVATAAGVATGLTTWTITTSAGVAALIVASQLVFTALKLAGVAYLVFLGIQALRSAIFGGSERRPNDGLAPTRLPRRVAYRQGVLSNLGNPKILVFFLSLLPQFVSRGQASFFALLLLGLIFCSMTLTWLTAYAVVVARIGDFLRRDRIRRGMEALTGFVLIGFGFRLATERR